MKTKRHYKFSILAILYLMIASCSSDMSDIDNVKTTSKHNFSKPLLALSYDVTTYVDYQVNSFGGFSKLDLSYLNPMSSKQHIAMKLFEDGQMNTIIEEKSFDKETIIKHNIKANDILPVSKTEIIGNTIIFYDKYGNTVNSSPFQAPSNKDMVQNIKKLKFTDTRSFIEEMITQKNGDSFYKKMTKMIKEDSKNGLKVIKQGENFVTLRIPSNYKNYKNKENVVILINKKIKKIVASRAYSQSNQILQRTYYGYKNQMMNAIKTIELIKLPSGKEVNMVTNTEIAHLKFSINNKLQKNNSNEK